MGAFTLKLSAFQTRPWELIQLEVVNYLQSEPSEPTSLRAQLRSNFEMLRLQSQGWLNDRTRFIVDGLRRQRVLSVWLGLAKKPWPVGLSFWWTFMVGHTFWYRCDAWLANHAVPHRLYRLVQRGRRPAVVGFDQGGRACVYHGIYGFNGLSCLTDLILPGCHPWEEDSVVLCPTGVPKLITWATTVANLVGFVARATVARAIFSFVLRHNIDFKNGNVCHGVYFSSRVSCSSQLITLV